MTPQQIEKLERGEPVEMTGEESARFQLETFNRVCTERDEARARVEELETAGTELLDAYRADVDAGLKHIFGIPPGPDPAFAAERLAHAVDAFAVLFNR